MGEIDGGEHDGVVLKGKWLCGIVFFFNDTATTEIYTLSLHDALPISLKSLKGSKSKDQLNHKHRNYASKGFRTFRFFMEIGRAHV